MKKFFVVAILVSLFGCTTLISKKDTSNESSNAKKVSVMTYNVENLFDTEDDPAKNDEAFLPLSKKSSLAMKNKCHTQNDNPRYLEECLEKNWSESILKRKFQRITDVVKQVGDKKGPDILILQEVENKNVLERWRDEYLKELGYQTIALVEGPDERGIDTAVISRLPLLQPPQLHQIDLTSPEDPKARPTRGILETQLRLPNGDRLAVFAVHFPSQGAPTPARVKALEVLQKATAALPPHTQVIVGGDFNISAKEDWKEKLFDKYIAPKFAISHKVGCKDCAGTIYYPKDKTWSFFDVLLFSPEMAGGLANWQVVPESIRIVNSSVYQTNRWGSPARFGNGRGGVGVSDHWPVYAELQLNKSITVGNDKEGTKQ